MRALRLVSTKVATAVFGLSKYQVYDLRRKAAGKLELHKIIESKTRVPQEVSASNYKSFYVLNFRLFIQHIDRKIRMEAREVLDGPIDPPVLRHDLREPRRIVMVHIA